MKNSDFTHILDTEKNYIVLKNCQRWQGRQSYSKHHECCILPSLTQGR